MELKFKKIKIALYFGILLLLFSKPAYAYLDPGTGSYLLQIMAAVFFTALFFFKSWWNKAKKLFLKIISRKDEQTIGKDSIKKE